VLEDTLLDDVQRRDLQRTGANATVSLSSEALTRASGGYRTYAALRATRQARVEEDVVGASLENQREDFEEVCAALAEAAGQLGADSIRPLVAEIPGLFQGASTGDVALRKYWLGLGFPASEVDHVVAELANAGEGLVQIAGAVQTGSDWPEAVNQFGARNPDPIHWGFGFSGDGELHPTAGAFVTTCRQAGVTPSLYVIASIVLLLHKLTEEATRE
jgi:hypothetical protein